MSCRRKAQLPSFTAIHHSHHASPCRTCFRSRRTKDYHNSPTNIISTSGGCGNSAVRCTCAACFPSPPTSLFSPVVLRLRTTLLLSRTLLSSPDDAAVSSRPPPSRTSPPPAADGLPATVLLRQLLPAHEALTHRLEGLLRGMRVRLIIWDFCLYCCGSILMRYCFSPSPLFLILW